MKTFTYSLATCAALLLAGPASAHVVLQDQAAAPGATYRAAFQIGHGCDGSPTTGIRVLIPEGFVATKPMPKPGWSVVAKVARLAKPYTLHGQTMAEDVVEVTWTANSKDNALPDALFDEFVLRGTTPKQAGPLWFKVLQTCEKGQTDWAQVPAQGSSTRGLQSPAALLEIIGAASEGHGH